MDFKIGSIARALRPNVRNDAEIVSLNQVEHSDLVNQQLIELLCLSIGLIPDCLSAEQNLFGTQVFIFGSYVNELITEFCEVGVVIDPERREGSCSEH